MTNSELERLAILSEEMGEAMDIKMQSFENSFSTLQNILNEVMQFFMKGQEDRHKELMKINNCLNDHARRIDKLENKPDRNKRFA